MRRIGIALTCFAILLTGCTHGSKSATPPSAPPTKASANGLKSVADTGPFPTVTGAFGDRPVLTFDAQATPSPQLQRKVLELGTGPAIVTGDLLAFDDIGQIWRGAVFDNSYDRHVADTVQIGIGNAIPGWDKALVGLTVGSRVLLTVPPADGYGPSGNPAAGIKATDTLVFVVDIARRYNLRSEADQAAVAQPAPKLAPSVSGPLDRAPTMTVPKGVKPPTKRETFILDRGSGPLIVNGTVAVHYQAINYAGVFQSSTWQYGTPSSVPVGNASVATGGLFDGLAGIPVGSRVLILAPAPKGQDVRTQSAVVVVDILDQITTAKQMRP